MMSRKSETKDFRLYKREAISAAIQLYYPQDVVDRIRNAQTEAEIINILHDAREAS